MVSRVVETRAAIAALQAQESAILAEAGDLVLARTAERRAAHRAVANDLPLREVTSELGAAMRLSDRSVQARMSDASRLSMFFPATLAAFRAGSIDSGHVAAITDAGMTIADAEARTPYEKLLLEAAEFETPTRLRAIAKVVAARLDPDTVEAPQERARADRRVRLIDLEDGMARLLIDLPATLAHAIHDRLTQMAHSITADEIAGDLAPSADIDDPGAADTPTAGSPASETIITGPGAARGRRTMDQIRADALADLLLTGSPTGHCAIGALGAIRAHVQVTIPVLTLAGVGNEPALLSGYGPIDRETAIALAAGAPGFDRVMFDPCTGAPMAVDRYRPSSELVRFLRVRDERCRFPGCNQKPWRCDADHTVAHSDGGPTSECNLACFCRRHHTVKHSTGWRVTQLGKGVLRWTSPTGRRYLDRPPALVRFVPSPGFGVEGTIRDDPAPPF